MKLVILIATLLFAFNGISQVDTLIPNYFQFDYDSVHLEVWDISFKETSTPIPDPEAPTYLTAFSWTNDSMLKRIKLSKEKGDEILSHLSEPSSYDNERAQLYHFNIVFTYFDGENPVNTIDISTLTGNISSSDHRIGRGFQNNCSQSLGSYMLALLTEFDIIEFAEYDEVDLNGLK